MPDEKVPTGAKVIAVIIIIIYWWTVIGIVASIFLWKGKNWARITIAIMCGFVSLLGFWLLAGVGGNDIYDVITIVLNLAISFYLFSNKKIDRYFGRTH